MCFTIWASLLFKVWFCLLRVNPETGLFYIVNSLSDAAGVVFFVRSIGTPPCPRKKRMLRSIFLIARPPLLAVMRGGEIALLKIAPNLDSCVKLVFRRRWGRCAGPGHIRVVVWKIDRYGRAGLECADTTVPRNSAMFCAHRSADIKPNRINSETAALPM